MSYEKEFDFDGHRLFFEFDVEQDYIEYGYLGDESPRYAPCGISLVNFDVYLIYNDKYRQIKPTKEMGKMIKHYIDSGEFYKDNFDDEY